MTINSKDQTTLNPILYNYKVYYTTSTAAKQTTCNEDASSEWGYTSSYYTETYVYNDYDHQKIKKLLKKLQSEMCKIGWVDHKFFYLELLEIPMRLRGVRLEGRGWANKK